MGLSETIVAAIIGALATMATAIVQLLRNRPPGETRPKKNRTRSVLATIALMIGCIVGGYAWSALRAVSAKEELTATMQAEFSRQFAEFAARQNQLAANPQGAAGAAGGALSTANAGARTAEALAHLPPCHISPQTADAGPVTCDESTAQRVALCAAVPAAAETRQVRLQSRVPKSETPWLERDAGAPTLGSLHIGAEASEAVSPELRSVCLEVANWSVEDTLAVRLIVDYDFAPPAKTELTAAAPGGATL
ncbi:MAG TPA: hypothetical protein VFS13_19160 [Steroidobacteraceae bacterium]|jgi:hypothetical protein|nr:hypothetical protein [Steroidobacteraceae bacterium]